MKSFLWKIFPPYEVRVAIEEARDFLSTNAGPCLPVIEPEVVDLLKDAVRTVYSIRIDGMKPDHLVLILITNVVGHAIGSGSFHIYRGSLSMMGHDMLALWRRTQNALLEGGYASQQEVDEDNSWIEEQVRQAG